MIHFNQLDREELAENGLLFESEEQADLFADVIREELKVRIGEEISRLKK